MKNINNDNNKQTNIDFILSNLRLIVIIMKQPKKTKNVNVFFWKIKLDFVGIVR